MPVFDSLQMVLEKLVQVSGEFVDVEVFLLCIRSSVTTQNALVGAVDALDSFVNDERPGFKVLFRFIRRRQI